MSDEHVASTSCYATGCRRDECREAQNTYRQQRRLITSGRAPQPGLDQAARFPAVDGSQPCASTDPELFFPEKGESPTAAKALCGGCEFVRDCLAYALTHGVSGVWGATTERQRADLRTKHGIRAVPMSSGFYVRHADADTTTDDHEESA